MQQKRRICVLGSANVDHFVYVHHIPAAGETIQASNFLVANGGKGANQAVAAAKLAGVSDFLGQVGSDDQMRHLKAEMEQAGVILSWQLKQSGTGKAFIYVDSQGENSIVILGGANMDYKDLSHLDQSFKLVIAKCDYLLLQKEVPMEIDLLAAKYAHGLGKIVVLDCGGRDDPIPEEMLGYITYLSPNETELLRIDPSINPQNLVHQIRTKVLSKWPNLRMLLKQGSRGSSIVTKDLHIQCPSASKVNPTILAEYDIVDTVGAGDCFTAAYAVRHSELNWSKPEDLVQNYKKAMLFGNSAAFLCITKKGAMPSLPLRQVLDSFVKKFSLNC